MKTKKNKRLWLWFDRTLAHDSLRQVVILLVILAAAFVVSMTLLAIFGQDVDNYCAQKNISKWVLPFYLLIDANAFTSIYSDKHIGGWAIFTSCIIYVAGVIIFTGMIISVMTNMIERRVEDHRKGHLHYLESGHYIILGFDDMVPSIITHVFEKDKDAYVLVLSSAETPFVREKLCKSFCREKMKHIIINYGHRVSAESYEDICLESAEQVYVVGNHSKKTHDAINVECVDSICRYLGGPKIKQRPNRITCVFKDLDTYAAFKTSEIFKRVRDLGMEFVPYNFYTGWAKQVFVKREYKDFDNYGVKYYYPCVYGNGITPDDEKYVHLVFVGTTNFAVAFAMEAAHVLHFPNAGKHKTRITFIEKNADTERDEFITRYRHFFEVQSYYYYDLTNNEGKCKKQQGTEEECKEKQGTKEECKEKQGRRDEYVLFTGSDRDFLDVEFEFIKGDVFSKKVQDKLSAWADEHDKKQYLSIFLALSDQRQNFVLGMNMPDAVYDKEIPLFIRQDRSDNFVTNLRNADKKDDKDKLPYNFVDNGVLTTERRNARYANIYPFGMNETAYSADEHSLNRAKLINYLYETANYETYRFSGLLVLDAIPNEKIWKDAENYWSDLTVALKWSNLYSAYTIRTKLRTLRAMRGLDIEDASSDHQPLSDHEVDVLAEVEHNRWNVEKLLMGFRKAREREDKYAHVEFADKLQMNKKLFIHHEIRPFEELDNISELDREFSRYIPWIMKMTETNDRP